MNIKELITLSLLKNIIISNNSVSQAHVSVKLLAIPWLMLFPPYSGMITIKDEVQIPTFLQYIFTLLPEGRDMMYIISSIHSEHLAKGRCWAHVAPKPPLHSIQKDEASSSCDTDFPWSYLIFCIIFSSHFLECIDSERISCPPYGLCGLYSSLL